MSNRTKGDYAVGYGKPPLKTRFQKGRSGNPAGRPAGAPNIATALERALSALVTVTENGRRLTRSKMEVAITQVVNKAASGDLRAVDLMLDMLPLLEPAGAGTGPTPDLIADRAFANKLLARLLDRSRAPEPTEPPDDD